MENPWKSYENWWFGASPISGNHHIVPQVNKYVHTATIFPQSHMAQEQVFFGAAWCFRENLHITKKISKQSATNIYNHITVFMDSKFPGIHKIRIQCIKSGNLRVWIAFFQLAGWILKKSHPPGLDPTGKISRLLNDDSPRCSVFELGTASETLSCGLTRFVAPKRSLMFGDLRMPIAPERLTPFDIISTPHCINWCRLSQQKSASKKNRHWNPSARPSIRFHIARPASDSRGVDCPLEPSHNKWDEASGHIIDISYIYIYTYHIITMGLSQKNRATPSHPFFLVWDFLWNQPSSELGVPPMKAPDRRSLASWWHLARS